MGRTKNLRVEETRGLLRLTNQLHRAEPLRRKVLLLEGLCALLDGNAGRCVIHQTAHPNALSSAEILSNTDYRRPNANGNGANDDGSSVLLTGRSGELIMSTLSVPNSTVAATLQIGSPSARFSPRQRAVLDMFHQEMTWIYMTDVLLTSSSAKELPPRARETLEHLLSGLSEKQIASRLNLSPNTVHHYVKIIHRKFEVSSRGELLARWVGRNYV